jgi:dihydroorotate dehydrogenase
MWRRSAWRLRLYFRPMPVANRLFTRKKGSVLTDDRPRSPGTAGVSGLMPLVISAPFGNYIQPRGSTPTLGTFTLERRPGRLLQIIKTVRYRRGLRAWVNKIGLRNPGMDWLAGRVSAGRIDVSDKLVSVHGFNTGQWAALLNRIGEIKPMAVELNMSCPNVGEIDWPADLFSRAIGTGVPVIVKLPPVNYQAMVEQAVDAGVRVFHCCNTLPVAEGGMSGRPLKPVTLDCIRDLRGKSQGGELTIIGGGGIYEVNDIDDYAQAGADHFALGTQTMNPVYLFSHRGLAPFVEHARRRFNPASCGGG